ncbi:MAG TPA: FUSC family protein, partial [Novosphingobium sp.]|nr:FUSC family protein [Novosphingobium sp.]
FLIGLDRPYWAMLTVYISSQPLAAAALSKGVFRIGGTLIGAAASVLFVPLFVQEPILLSLVMALWVGCCLFASLLDRTPRAYLFMLAGYTAALITFPAVDTPERIFDLAVLRGQEISIGVACSSLLHTLIPAHDFEQAIAASIRGVRGGMNRWIADVLRRPEESAPPDPPGTMAAAMTELRLLATHLRFHPDNGVLGRDAIMAMWDHLVLLLPLVDAIEDRIAQIHRLGGLSPALAELLRALGDWASQAPADLSASRADIEAALATWHAGLHPQGWEGLLELNLHARLAELVQRIEAAKWLVEHTLHPATPLPAALRPLLAQRTRRRWHRDGGLALRSAVAAGIGVFGSCLFWIYTAWPEGGVMAMICAVVCSFFATLDNPRPAQTSWLVWTALSLPIAALYLFAILPRLDTFEMLMAALAPTLVGLGVFLGVPALYARMMTLVVGFCGAIALTDTLNADFAAFLNNNIAQLAGAAAAILTTAMLRVIGVERAVGRILRRNWRDLARLASPRSSVTREEWNSLMVDRAALLAPRLAQLEAVPGHALALSNGLREVRIGLNLIQIGTMSHELGSAGRAALAQVQLRAGALCAAQGRARPANLHQCRADALRALQDLVALCRLPTANAVERELLNILVGMTRALLPDSQL